MSLSYKYVLHIAPPRAEAAARGGRGAGQQYRRRPASAAAAQWGYSKWYLGPCPTQFTAPLMVSFVVFHLLLLLGSSSATPTVTGPTAAPPPPPTTAQGLPCVGFKSDVASCGEGCTRHVLNDTVASHGAGCLDGSAPGFYFRPGRGASAKKFLLWSHGGGWCRSEGECAGRALTYEGSSSCNPEAGPPRANMNTGIMSSDCTENPRFCNYTVAYFMYCDGGSWTGNRDEPVPTSQAEYADPPVPSVHLKGRRNLAAIMDTLLTPTFGLAAAEKVLYAGASAGGLTAYVSQEAAHGRTEAAQQTDSLSVCLSLSESLYQMALACVRTSLRLYLNPAHVSCVSCSCTARV